ncbi:MAG: diguanylate cyclase [Coriobacteriia bacterium]|nr:diguanylate cyclase [Coriobacteriia bacterium]
MDLEPTATSGVQDGTPPTDFERFCRGHDAVMLLMDGDTGQLLDASDGALRFYGYTRPQIKSMSIRDINQLSPEEVDLERHKAQAQERAYFIFPHRLASGEIRTVEVHSSPVSVGGDPVLLSVIHDVSGRENAERAGARLQATNDSLLDPHVRLEAVRDESGLIVDFVYVEANDAACIYNGLSSDELVGARLLDLLPGRDGTGLLDRYRSVVETGEALILDDFCYEQEPVDGTVHVYDIRAVKVGDGLSYTWRDVGERHAAAAAIMLSEEHFRLLAENSSDAVLLINDDVLEWVSPAIKQLLGWDPGEWVGRNATDFVHPDDREQREVDLSLESGDRKTCLRFRVRAKDGAYHWIEVHTSRYERTLRHGRRVASFRTIDAEVAAEEGLQRRAEIDELTGLLSRSEVLERLRVATEATRRSGSRCAVLFCDIDDMKDANDTHGHSGGDTLLRTFAARIGSCIRRDDFAGRFGGDEMLVVLTGVHGSQDAMDIADKIQRCVAERLDLANGYIEPSVSIGVAVIEPDEGVESAIRRADTAMYEAKAAGGGRTVAARALLG